LLAASQQFSHFPSVHPSIASLVNYASNTKAFEVGFQSRHFAKEAVAPVKKSFKRIFPNRIEELDKLKKKAVPPQIDFSENIKQSIASASNEEELVKVLDTFADAYSNQSWIGKHDCLNSSFVPDFVKACAKVNSWNPLTTLWEKAYRYGVDPTVELLHKSVAAPVAANDGCSASLVLFYGSCYITNIPKDITTSVRTALDAQEKSLSEAGQDANKELLEKIVKYREALNRLKL